MLIGMASKKKIQKKRRKIEGRKMHCETKKRLNNNTVHVILNMGWIKIDRVKACQYVSVNL